MKKFEVLNNVTAVIIGSYVFVVDNNNKKNIHQCKYISERVKWKKREDIEKLYSTVIKETSYKEII